jgi:lipopolysaccharide export system protein LptA
MRRTRRLILLVLAIVTGGIAIIYNLQKATQARNAPPPPRSLPESASARADDWSWEETRDGKPSVRVRARDQRLNAEGNRIDLTDVELQLFGKDATTFDRVRSAKADFDLTGGILFSDGAVEITMGVPADPAVKPKARLIHIKSSGVRFESKTGKAMTERAASFQFDRGEGSCTGALYDPGTRELQMHRDVRLRWRGQDPGAIPMDIEAASLLYKEDTSEILLSTWSKFRRATLSMEGGNAIVKLRQEGVIEGVDAFNARGTDRQPERTIDYAADLLHIRFDEKGVLQTVNGENNAKLLSRDAAATTSVNSSRLDLTFVPQGNDSLLRTALATGSAVLESHPVPRPNVPPADSRIVRSETVSLRMRENGREVEQLQTEAPGTVQFLPNRPGMKKRTVAGQQLRAEYGANNQIKKFIATEASTTTEAPPVKGSTPRPPALTWSKGLTAHFDDKTGDLKHLEQWDNFRYEEGDRRAKSDRADLYSPSDEIVLTGTARVWDPTGATAADRIQLNQKSGDVEAAGNVASTRQPEKKDKKKPNQNGMLTGEEPVQARAGYMTSKEDNRLITYEGNALLWQGSNRITAHRITIDRRTNHLEASSNVVTQLIDKSEAGKKQNLFTIVKAPKMVYDDTERLAHYTGGAALNRGGMIVTAREIRAWLKSGEADSSFDHAFADGEVKIDQNTPVRKRVGRSEHAEYYADDGKVILSGGTPEFTDSVKGSTKGEKITYYSNDDRLFVEGAEKKPVESRILRRPS